MLNHLLLLRISVILVLFLLSCTNPKHSEESEAGSMNNKVEYETVESLSPFSVQKGLTDTSFDIDSEYLEEYGIDDTFLIRETFEEEDVYVNDYLIEDLQGLRKNFKRINCIDQWEKIRQIDLWETTEGGFATYYYSSGQTLEKILVRQFGETRQELKEYYLMDGKLSFLFAKMVVYNRPIYWDSSQVKDLEDKEVFDYDKSKIIEERNYILNNELVHQIVQDDCGSPFSEEYLKMNKISLMEEFERYLKLESKAR